MGKYFIQLSTSLKFACLKLVGKFDNNKTNDNTNNKPWGLKKMATLLNHDTKWINY